MAVMTTSSNANLLQDVFLAKRFVEALRSEPIVAKFGVKEVAADNVGKTVRWQYFGNLSQFTTALTEGADPTSPQSLATTAVTAPLAEYGTYVEPTALMLRTSAMGTKAEIVKAAAKAGALTIDTLCRSQSLEDTTNTASDLGTALEADDVRLGASTLKNADVKPNSATTGGQYYALICTPAAFYDMMGDGTPKWSAVKETTKDVYTDRPGMNGGQFLYGVEVFQSTNSRQDGSSNELMYILGEGGFGVVSMSTDLMDPSVIITDPNERVDKPIRNSGTIGVRLWFASELIRSNTVYEMFADA